LALLAADSLSTTISYYGITPMLAAIALDENARTNAERRRAVNT
jgi:hypothetical protein